jgi:hypothetical protein
VGSCAPHCACASAPDAHALAGASLLRGAGVPAEKSDPLSSESTQPPEDLKTAVVLPGAGALAGPSEQVAPLP